MGEDGKISARNRFTGTITSIPPGPVNAEVTLSMAAGRHVLTAVFKATSVFLASVE